MQNTLIDFKWIRDSVNFVITTKGLDNMNNGKLRGGLSAIISKFSMQSKKGAKSI